MELIDHEAVKPQEGRHGVGLVDLLNHQEF